MDMLSKEAIRKLEEKEATLVLNKNGTTVYQSDARGIGPALSLVTEHKVLSNGANVYDLIVGKAAAALFILCGVYSVFGYTMSDSAIELLHRHNIPAYWQIRTKNIINRQGTGLCPFEQAVLLIDEPSECLTAILQTREKLRFNQNTN